MKIALIALVLATLVAPAWAQQWPPRPPVNCTQFCTPQGICTLSCGP